MSSKRGTYESLVSAKSAEEAIEIAAEAITHDGPGLVEAVAKFGSNL